MFYYHIAAHYVYVELLQLYSSQQFQANNIGYQSKNCAIFHDTPVFLNTFSVQGNIVTLFLLVLLAYFNVHGVQQDTM